jgi:dienelactone hydrolase
LAGRLIEASEWLQREPSTRGLLTGYFGASTGGGAALVAAAEQPSMIHAVVSRGGRPAMTTQSTSTIPLRSHSGRAGLASPRNNSKQQWTTSAHPQAGWNENSTAAKPSMSQSARRSRQAERGAAERKVFSGAGECGAAWMSFARQGRQRVQSSRT